MSDLFRVMQAEVLEAAQPKPPTPTTIYLVAAWDTGDGYDGHWSIRRASSLEEFTDREKAEKFAAAMAGRWTHRTIIKIDLPAEGS
jgi:hypothetical protein